MDETTGTDRAEAPAASGDVVADALADVRADLDRRRASGDLPFLPRGELERQFAGVVEAVDSGFVSGAPIVSGDLNGPAVLQSWRPLAGRRGPVARILALVLSPLTRVSGVLVRRQVSEFSTRTAAVVEELVTRQNRMADFVSRSFLDRERRLEFRVAELEREVERLRLEAELRTTDGD